MCCCRTNFPLRSNFAEEHNVGRQDPHRQLSVQERRMTTTNTRPLRMSLVANAAFSLTSAGLMIFRPSLVSDWLGISAPFVLQAVGLGLAVFAADLFHQATRRRIATWRSLYASVADFLWVVGSFGLLALFPSALSQTGYWLVTSVASAVFLFGAWQLWAIGQAHKLPGSGQYRHCILVAVDAPADAIWRIIGQIGDIKHYMPSLKESVVLGGKTPGVGAVRMCEDRAGKRWAEECIAFKAGRGFDVRFLSEAPDFPFPVKNMRGGWEVIPEEGGSDVMVWWELEPKQKLLAPVLLPLLAFQADRDFPKVIQRMAADALGHSPDVIDQRSPGVLARLLPSFC